MTDPFTGVAVTASDISAHVRLRREIHAWLARGPPLPNLSGAGSPAVEHHRTMELPISPAVVDKGLVVENGREGSSANELEALLAGGVPFARRGVKL